MTTLPKMLNSPKQYQPDELVAQCDNCETKLAVAELKDIRDVVSRLEVGREMPAGECIKCNALAYLIKPTEEIIVEVRSGVADVTKCPDNCYVTIKDYDDDPDQDEDKSFPDELRERARTSTVPEYSSLMGKLANLADMEAEMNKKSG